MSQHDEVMAELKRLRDEVAEIKAWQLECNVTVFNAVASVNERLAPLMASPMMAMLTGG